MRERLQVQTIELILLCAKYFVSRLSPYFFFTFLNPTKSATSEWPLKDKLWKNANARQQSAQQGQLLLAWAERDQKYTLMTLIIACWTHERTWKAPSVQLVQRYHLNNEEKRIEIHQEQYSPRFRMLLTERGDADCNMMLIIMAFCVQRETLHDCSMKSLS